jgi:hypothetical protein
MDGWMDGWMDGGFTPFLRRDSICFILKKSNLMIFFDNLIIPQEKQFASQPSTLTAEH